MNIKEIIEAATRKAESITSQFLAQSGLDIVISEAYEGEVSFSGEMHPVVSLQAQDLFEKTFIEEFTKLYTKRHSS